MSRGVTSATTVDADVSEKRSETFLGPNWYASVMGTGIVERRRDASF